MTRDIAEYYYMYMLLLRRTIRFGQISSSYLCDRIPFLPSVLPRARMASTTAADASATGAFVSIDLKGYDQEQARLMDERCIVVDENDRAIGALDKKTCLCMDYDCDDRMHLEFSLPPPCAPRPFHGKHQQGSPPPRILSICLPTI